MSHLMVLMLYTNCDELQCKFKKHGTRKLSSSESINNIKSRNIEIANWFRLLYEAVMVFGNDTTKNDLIYHGLNVTLLFDQFSPNFVTPISTTTCLTVAHRFGENGIILALKPNGTREDVYFPVRWISTFPEEEEYLFVEATNLNIVDIREYSQIRISNISYLRAKKK
eukprot:460157_1